MAAATIDNPAPIAEATQKSTIVLADVLAAFKAAGHDAGDGADVYCYDGNALPHSTFWAHKNGSEHVVYVQAGNKTPPIEWTASGAAKVLYGTIGFVALPDLRTDNPPTVFGHVIFRVSSCDVYLNSECSAPVRTTYSPLARHIMGLARDTGVSVLASLAKQYDLLEQIERAIELYAPAPVKEEENKNIHGNRYPSHKRKRVQ